LTGRPTLALLIPAYNAASHLPRLLASAHAQSEPFDEIWVYDDASSDDTAGVAEALGATVVRGELNKGCSAGKNLLARSTQCDWLHFHDADDALMPNFGSRARLWMDHGKSDVVLFPFEERDDATGQFRETWRFDPEEVARDARSYAIRHQINPFCGLYRRDAFLAAGGYDEDPEVLFNEDVAMHIQLAFAGLSFAADTEVSVINYRRANSMSRANQLRCAQAHFAVLRKTAARPGAAAYGPEIATKLWKAAGVLSAYLDWERADAAVALALRLAPEVSEGSAVFRAMAKISPPLALRAREASVRALQPSHRAGYPTLGQPRSRSL
jgi:glycosyltransferase involved in cell wall biosynthesis